MKKVLYFVLPLLHFSVVMLTACNKQVDHPTQVDTYQYFLPEGLGDANDRMENVMNGNRPFSFYLGRYTDTEHFSKYAKSQLKKSGNVIEFWVCPTKDATRVATIRIERFMSSVDSSLDEATIEMTDDIRGGSSLMDIMKKRSNISKEDLEKAKKTAEILWVGPIIYELGRHWYSPLKDDSLTSDVQPTARHEKVWLTPEAEIELDKLMTYISYGEITEKDGNLYAGKKELTKEEIKDLIKYGILNKKYFWSSPEVTPGYNEALKESKRYVK